MDKEALFEAAEAEKAEGVAEVEVPGGVVKLRALSRYEVALATKTNTGDLVSATSKILSMALVEPEMTEAEVEHWQKIAKFDTIQVVFEKANELSGLGKYAKQAQKEAYKSLRGES